jgi:hypothetical protein
MSHAAQIELRLCSNCLFNELQLCSSLPVPILLEMSPVNNPHQDQYHRQTNCELAFFGSL